MSCSRCKVYLLAVPQRLNNCVSKAAEPATHPLRLALRCAAASRRNEKKLDRPTTRYFTARLTATGVRVGDGDKADWYFLPLTLRNTHDRWYLRFALTYIRQMYPWWNQTMGHRHFVLALGEGWGPGVSWDR